MPSRGTFSSENRSEPFLIISVFFPFRGKREKNRCWMNFTLGGLWKREWRKEKRKEERREISLLLDGGRMERCNGTLGIQAKREFWDGKAMISRKKRRRFGRKRNHFDLRTVKLWCALSHYSQLRKNNRYVSMSWLVLNAKLRIFCCPQVFPLLFSPANIHNIFCRTQPL